MSDIVDSTPTFLLQNMTPTTPKGPKTARKEYSPHKRTKIATLHLLGYSKKEIAEKEGIPPGSVSGIVNRYRLQKSASSLPRAGRPRLLSERDKRHINRCIEIDPSIPPRALAERIGGHVSAATVFAYLEAAGISHTKALGRPKLTEDNAQQRLKGRRSIATDSQRQKVIG